MSKELKDCPFCESHNVFTYKYGGIDFFGCHSCGACVTFKDVRDEHKLQVANPFESWNRRGFSNIIRAKFSS